MPILWEDTPMRDRFLLHPDEQMEVDHQADGNAIFGAAFGLACTTLLFTLALVAVYLWRVSW
jgi:hypothetical protein